MQERTRLEDQLTSIAHIERELDDQTTLIELGESEKDEAVIAEGEAALRKLKDEVARRELEALLSGEADANDSYLGHQVGHRPGQGPQRVRLAQNRSRRASAGAHLPVRFKLAAAHLVCWRYRLPGGR